MFYLQKCVPFQSCHVSTGGQTGLITIRDMLIMIIISPEIADVTLPRKGEKLPNTIGNSRKFEVAPTQNRKVQRQEKIRPNDVTYDQN